MQAMNTQLSPQSMPTSPPVTASVMHAHFNPTPIASPQPSYATYPQHPQPQQIGQTYPHQQHYQQQPTQQFSPNAPFSPQMGIAGGALPSVAAPTSVPIPRSVSPASEQLKELEQLYDANDPTVASTSEYLSSYAIPNDMSTSNNSPLPLGVLFSPAVHLHPQPPRYHANIQRCDKCRVHINMYCRFIPAQRAGEPHQWSCSLCQHQQVFESQLNQFVQAVSPRPAVGGAPPTSNPVPVELAYKVIETVTGTSPQAAILPPTVFAASSRNAPGSPLSSGSGLNFLFAIDRNITKTDMGDLKRSLASLVKELPPDAGVSLLAFSNTVTIYDLKQSGVACGDVFTGETGATIEELEGFIQQHGVVLPRAASIVDNFIDCLEAIEQSSSSLDQQKLFNPRAIGAAVEWATAMVQAGRELDQITRQAAASKSSTTSSGSSSFASAPPASFCFSHFFIFTSGPPDFGPGETTLEVATPENERAIAFFSELGHRARSNQLQIEYFPMGMAHFSTPIVRKLVDPSGGSIFMQKSFGDAFLSDVRNCIFRPIGYNGSVEMYFSGGLKITRVIGSVTQLSESSEVGDNKPAPVTTNRDGESADAETDARASAAVSHLTLQLSNCRPDESIAIYYALKEDLPQDYVYLQFVFTYRDWNHQQIRRVMTRRLRTTGNYSTFVRSIDVKVVAMLLVKRLVLLAVHGESELNIQRDIDGQVRDTCHHFGRERRERNGAVVYELPQELNILPLLLFHVRRGPLLGPILQHPDDIDVCRFIFLHANRQDSLRACIPALLSFNAKGELEELPLETLALQSNRILLLDHHTQILVWSGSLVAGSGYDAYRKACLERAAAHSLYRLPKPEILSFNEKSSASRWMQVRLIPSHKDTEEWQNLTFPQLRSLTPQQRKDLIDQFLPSDEISFVQFYHMLFEHRDQE